MFFKGSRYATVGEATLVNEAGREIRYKTTRFVPETRALLGHRVVAGERLDLIAHRHYRDPERFWRICDANRAMWPDDLLEVGRVIRVPPSEG